MTVYIIAAERTGSVKIGKSKNPQQRLGCLQKASPDTLAIVRLLPGGHDEESWFHQRFKHLRLHGEWFRYDPDMMVCNPPTRAPKERVVVRAPGMRQLFLRQIDQFLARTGMSRHAFGMAVAKNHKFVSQIRKGKNVTLRLMEVAEDLMRATEPSLQPRGQAAASSARASAAFSNSDPAARPQVFMGAPS